MALQSIIGGMLIPSLPPFSTAEPAFRTLLTMDASTEKIAFVVYVPKSGTLDKFEFFLGDVSLNPASKIKVSFQGLSGYLPDGIVDEYRIINAADLTTDAWVAPGLLTNDGTDTGTKRSVTRGDRVACVFEFDTFTAADLLVVRTTSVEDNAALRPCVGYFYNGATWSSPADNGAVLAVKYDDGTYPNLLAGVLPISGMAPWSLNINSDPDEVGAAFSLPAPVRIGGVVFRVKLAAACDVVLYDDQSNVLRTVSLSADTLKASSSYQLLIFPTTVDDQGQSRSGDIFLAANVVYRCVIKPTTTTNVEVGHFSSPSVEILNSMPMGANMYLTERLDGGTWYDSPTLRPWFGLFVTAIDHDISGGSGGPGFEGDL
jgi:hypothetical protein